MIRLRGFDVIALSLTCQTISMSDFKAGVSSAVEQRWSEAVRIVSDRSTSRPAGTSPALTDAALGAIEGLVTQLGLAHTVEFGSGRSTLALARALQRLDGATCLSVENDARSLRETEETLDRAGARQSVELLHSPIRLRRVGPYVGFCYDWQPPAGRHFDFALIDGPRARSFGRFLTLPLLWPVLRPGSLVLLDDASRAGLEAVWLRAWGRMFGPGLRIHVVATYARGLALLMKLDASTVPGIDAGALIRSYPEALYRSPVRRTVASLLRRRTLPL